MKRRLVLRFGLLAIAVVFVAILYAWLMSPARRINRDTYEQIQVGMTESEVEALIGYPPGIYGSKAMIVSRKGFTVGDLLLIDGPLAGIPPPVCHSCDWASSSGLILVRFTDGVVEHKAFWDVEFRFRDMVQGWLASFRK